MKKNHIWIIEWKCSTGWTAIDFEHKEKDANVIMDKYKKCNEKNNYRVKKYVSE
jgi:hypothetical protein